ncbi:CvpA family protein [Geoalkalibacter subterraneus]|uniref:Colicin V production protein n=1 Tax=Geoalkalibacter subterraneus TaxID=483547 RepID=A0A0B5FM12_9BACT|nr:CvpA family protein [Geoalkalibacter subterraneus]AJF05674.1 colicin V production protein [Geoalkalibacter subterraneus]
MNFVDIAILVILAAFMIKGLTRGLVKEICALAGLVVGGLAAFAYYAPLAQWLLDTLGVPSQIAVVAAFLALFLLSLVVFAVLGFVLSRFVRLIFLGGFNRVFGGLFGLAQGAVLLALILFALSLGPLPDFLKDGYRGSRLSSPFIKLGAAMFQAGHDYVEHN